MTNPFRLALCVFLLAALAACASGPSRPPASVNAAAAIGNHRLADRLLGEAQRLRAEGDCEKAAPIYRALAANGQGFEIAQTGLGACALELAAMAAPAERRLFLLEARLWLERAAYANHPQAQQKLAMLYAAPGALGEDKVRALGWAMVFNANGGRQPINLAQIDRRTLEKIENDLTSEGRAAAIAFAENFRPITLKGFTPPARERAQDRPRPDSSGGRGRGRRRPPR